MPAEPPTLQLNSPRRSLLKAFSSPLLLVLLGAWGLSAGGFAWLPAILLAAGLVLLVVVSLDQPTSTTVHRDGVTRRTLLRQQTFGWRQIQAIERAPSGGAHRQQRVSVEGDDHTQRHGKGPLVARMGRRSRSVLVARIEGHAEFHRLVELVEAHADHVVVRAAPPPIDSVPTSMYRRDRGQAEV